MISDFMPEEHKFMAYTLKSLGTPDFYRCNDDIWLAILETAKKLGWKPEGTRYDLVYQIDELFDEGADAMYNMFVVVQVTQWFNSWDRNYTDRENQVVSGDDAHYMRLNLENSGVDPRFMDFLSKGAFRICSM